MNVRLKRRLSAVIAGAAVLAVSQLTPAQAVGSTEVLENSTPTAPNHGVRDGFDFDPGCFLSTSPSPPTAPAKENSYRSPGGTGCPGVSAYDGSAEGIDLNSVKLESITGGDLRATFNVDGAIPAAGSTSRSQANYDLPTDASTGGGYKVMYSNKDKSTNGNNSLTGCARPNPPGGHVRDVRGHWQDGYHSFVGFDVAWDGTKWFYSAQLGEYDPSPDGAFFFIELGTNDGSGWVSANPHYPFGTDWNVTVTGSGPTTIQITYDGIYKEADVRCAPSTLYERDFGSTRPGAYSSGPRPAGCGTTYVGDCIQNVKGLTTADAVLSLPVTVPLSLTCDLPTGDLVCEADLTSVGGFIFFADTTHGQSKPGVLNSNIKKISYAGGAIGGTDTLGDGPNCPFPTSTARTTSGVTPENPLWAANQNRPCQIDDEIIPAPPSSLNTGITTWKATFFSEWYPTPYGFVLTP